MNASTERKPLVLLVEDDPNDEALTRRALARLSPRPELVVVRDGVEALDWLFRSGAHAQRDPHEQPRVVLLDLKIPRIDGLEVLRQARADARTRCQPIVVLTSSSEERDIQQSYDLGANSVVRKAVTFEEFVSDLNTLGAYWLEVNQPPIAVRSP